MQCNLRQLSLGMLMSLTKAPSPRSFGCFNFLYELKFGVNNGIDV
jgi:hypothetical protein